MGEASIDSGYPSQPTGDASGIECGTVVDLDSPISDGPPEAQLCSVVLPCGWQPQYVAKGCTLLYGDADIPLGCFLFEDAGCASDAYSPPESGPLTIACYCDNFTGGGRRPRSLRVVHRGRAYDPLGAYLSRMAMEEAASVHAFEQLGAELKWLRAPSELVVAASCSARDEERHARTITGLARRRGAEPALQFVERRRSRDIVSIARHNAVEGCVRETYGALVAHWQAARAADPELRAIFARIARDETRHAALGWAIARWADTRLTASGRRRVARARRRAVRTLERELVREPHANLVREAGLPSAADARLLLGAMATQLALGSHRDALERHQLAIRSSGALAR